MFKYYRIKILDKYKLYNQQKILILEKNTSLWITFSTKIINFMLFSIIILLYIYQKKHFHNFMHNNWVIFIKSNYVNNNLLFMISKQLFVALIWGCSILSCSSPFDVTLLTNQHTDNADNYQINLNTISFEGTNKKSDEMVKPLNVGLKALTDSLLTSTIADADSFFTSYKSDLEAGKIKYPQPAFRYELYSSDTAFTVSEQIISTLTTTYTFAGGAHGNTEFYALNYSPKEKRFLSISDLLDLSQQIRIDSLLQAYFTNPNNCFNTDPTLAKATAINVTPTHLRFTYAHYTLGAYYCGAPVVEIPLESLKEIYLLK